MLDHPDGMTLAGSTTARILEKRGLAESYGANHDGDVRLCITDKGETEADGTTPEWPLIVLGARDPAAEAALQAYAEQAERLGYDPEYVADVLKLADDFAAYRREHGEGDPTAPPERSDDPSVVARMRQGKSA